MIAEPLGQAATGKNVNLLKPLLTYGVPYGGRQIEKTIRGLQDMDVLPRVNVSTENGVSVKNQPLPASYTSGGNIRFPIEPTAANYARTLAFGPFSTPEGKAYLKNGAKPLSAEQTAKVEDAYGGAYGAYYMPGVPPAAAVGAFQNLRNADTDGSGGRSKAEVEAYVRKIAAEYGLSGEQTKALLNLINRKSDASDEEGANRYSWEKSAGAKRYSWEKPTGAKRYSWE
jgi:hypothetical protein